MRRVRIVPRQPLRPSEKVRVACEILVAYARARRWLSRLDIKEATTEARRPLENPGSRVDGGATLIGARLGYLVYATLRLLPTDSRCLIRSLVLSHVLATRGIHSELVIGVRSEPDFAAHAWVEREGIALLPADEFAESRLVHV